jgi:hypothetical protein
METTIKHYGITEAKKVQLDHLSDEIVDAAFLVDQNKAIVRALTVSLSKFKDYFAKADANRTIALQNKNKVKSTEQQVKYLQTISTQTAGKTQMAKGAMADLTQQVREVVNKLIYAAESINKLCILINRKKAKNPLISDELISIVATTGSDTNTAIALTLTAMKSTFTALASMMEAHAASELEAQQVKELYQLISEGSGENYSLSDLIESAYEQADQEYDKYRSAVEITSTQLDEAQANLTTAESKLVSLQAGFNAANAAALAS